MYSGHFYAGPKGEPEVFVRCQICETVTPIAQMVQRGMRPSTGLPRNDWNCKSCQPERRRLTREAEALRKKEPRPRKRTPEDGILVWIAMIMVGSK